MRTILAGMAFLALTAALAAQPLPPPAPPQPPLPGQPGDVYDPVADIIKQHKDLIPTLIESLKDLDGEVRQHSAMALASLGQHALKPLIEALADPVKDKRAAAAYALGYMGFDGRDAMPALMKALKDEEAVVRRSASQAISRIINGGEFGGVVGFGGHGMPFAGGGFGGGFGRAVGGARPAIGLPLAPAAETTPAPKPNTPEKKPQ